MFYVPKLYTIIMSRRGSWLFMIDYRFFFQTKCTSYSVLFRTVKIKLMAIYFHVESFYPPPSVANWALSPFNIVYLIPINFLFAQRRFNMLTKISQKYFKNPRTKRGQSVIKVAAKKAGAIKEIQKGTNCEILNLNSGVKR